MSEETIKPCPNCGNDHLCLHLLTLECFWECSHCDLQGPRKDTEAEANNVWNALPRREDFLAELTMIIAQLLNANAAVKADAEINNDTIKTVMGDCMVEASNCAIELITELARKYRPAEPEKVDA